MLYIGGNFANPNMGILNALSNVFTPRQFLKPSQWLRAIPLLQEAEKELRPLHLVTLEHGRNLFEALEALLLAEKRLRSEVEISREREEEEPWYPVKLSSQQFWLVEHLLNFRPLSDEGLSQVRAGYPRIFPSPIEADETES